MAKLEDTIVLALMTQQQLRRGRFQVGHCTISSENQRLEVPLIMIDQNASWEEVSIVHEEKEG